MRWDTCEVCGATVAAEPAGPWENVHFGYCPTCGGCLGRWMRDPVSRTWAPEPPHAFVGHAYYREAVWGDFYCPKCGTVKDRLAVPKKA